MTAIQKYLRDVSVRHEWSHDKISDMCKVHRTTVSKWLKPEEHVIAKEHLRNFRECLTNAQMYGELVLFDQAMYETYSALFETENQFGKEYVPLPFKDCLVANQSVLPDCLYNAADIYNFTEQFPDRAYFEVIAATERYGDIVRATDKIFPGKSQMELLRYESQCKLRQRCLAQYGLSENIFVQNILKLTCIPRHIGEIPEELREDIYKERLKQTYFKDKDVNISIVLNTMLKCSIEDIIIGIAERKELQLPEKEIMAIERFQEMHLPKTKLTYETIYTLFQIKTINDTEYAVSLTERGRQILKVFVHNAPDL